VKQADRPIQLANDYHVRGLVQIISSKWALPVLHVLSKETLRYYEINAALPDITQKVLTDILRKLEGYGFISRQVYPTVPPKVEYSLTGLGDSFTTALSPAFEWVKANIYE